MKCHCNYQEHVQTRSMESSEPNIVAQLLSCILTNDGKVVKNPIEHQQQQPKIFGSWMFFNSLFNKLNLICYQKKVIGKLP